MNKFGKMVGMSLIVGTLAVAISGCQKSEGPAERAGKAMDNAAEKTGQQIEKVGDKMQDAAKSGKN